MAVDAPPAVAPRAVAPVAVADRVKTGDVAGVPIERAGEIHQDVDTITLYVGPQHQNEYFDYIVKTNPRRIIFNPGTENDELYEIADQNGIEHLEACTLVMLSTGQY